VLGADAELSGVTIRSTGGDNEVGVNATGVHGMRLRDVAIETAGSAGQRGIGLRVVDGATEAQDVDITLGEGNHAFGAWVQAEFAHAHADLTDVTVSAASSGPDVYTGLYVLGTPLGAFTARLSADAVTVDVSNVGNVLFGIDLVSAVDLEMRGSAITVTGTTGLERGVQVGVSSAGTVAARIYDSQLATTSDVIGVVGTSAHTVQIANSQLVGTIDDGPGAASITCFNVYDGAFAARAC
jgi:hypothetical protein